MHITLEADYAIRIVNCLVDASQRMDAQKIADAACVSLRFSLKILRKLVSSGIVQSFKGAKGGYVLAKEPSEITLKDVIETVEGPYRFSRCLNEEYPCSWVPDGECPYRGVFGDISTMVQDKLASVTFYDIKNSKNQQ